MSKSAGPADSLDKGVEASKPRVQPAWLRTTLVAVVASVLGTVVGGLILYVVTKEASDLRYEIDGEQKRMLLGARRARQIITVRNAGDRAARNVTLTIEPTGYKILQLIQVGDEGAETKGGGEGFDFVRLRRERIVPGAWWSLNLDWQDEWAPHDRIQITSDDGPAKKDSLLPSMPTLVLFLIVASAVIVLAVYSTRKEEQKEARVEARLSGIEQQLQRLSPEDVRPVDDPHSATDESGHP